MTAFNDNTDVHLQITDDRNGQLAAKSTAWSDPDFSPENTFM